MRRSTLQNGSSSIVAKSLFDSGWMTVQELSDELGLSRSRVRYGLQTLRSDNVLETRPRDKSSNEHRLTHEHSQEDIKDELA